MERACVPFDPDLQEMVMWQGAIASRPLPRTRYPFLPSTAVIEWEEVFAGENHETDLDLLGRNGLADCCGLLVKKVQGVVNQELSKIRTRKIDREHVWYYTSNYRYGVLEMIPPDDERTSRMIADRGALRPALSPYEVACVT